MSDNLHKFATSSDMYYKQITTNSKSPLNIELSHVTVQWLF